MNAHYRQGDTLLIRRDSLPEGAEERKVNGRVVIAEGEVSGHAHAVAVLDPTNVKEVVSDAGSNIETRFLVLERYGAQVAHEEHTPYTIDAGIFEMRPQMEWSDEMEPRRVLD
jgi:hypothetical protein